MNPLVSIIMPVKNGAKYLSPCIDSIIGQSFQNWELIIINDHSTDNTEALLNHVTIADPRIYKFDNTGNGIVDALNLAFAKCKGQLITRIDSDDLMPTGRLELMVAALLRSRPKTIVTGLVKYFSDQKISEGYLKYEEWLNSVNSENKQWENVYRECVIASPNWMIRKVDLLNAQAFNGLNYPEDYDLVLRWYANGFQVKVIPEVTLHWREHPERTSRNSENYAQKAFFDLKIRAFLENELNGESLIIWGNNDKTGLVANVLRSIDQPFSQYNLNQYKQIEDHLSPKLLVGVYPSLREREKLQQYLTSQNLEEGQDWWYI